MRQFMCDCLECGGKEQFNLNEPYPKYGDRFECFCKYCCKDTSHTLTLTRKLAAEQRREKEEKELRDSIIRCCEKYGFTCRFLYESVIITAPISSWQFAYHSSKKTLRQESSVMINFKTGDYAKTHEQFRDKKKTCEEVIEYIAAHDKWRQEQ